jgi:hypothetical protein
MPGLTQIAGIVEPQRAYNWEVEIVRTPVGLAASDNMKFRARGTGVPGRSFDTIDINWRWMNWKVSGRETGDKTITVRFWEGVDQMIRNALMQWATLVGDWFSGAQGDKSEVSGEIRIRLLDGKENTTRTVTLKNAMITAVDTVDVTYEASDVVEYTATIVYDYFEES